MNLLLIGMVHDGFGFKNGIILLDEPKSVYYSGQVILGRIKFELNHPLNFLTINVVHLGEANVKWTEEQIEIYSSVIQRKKVHYVGHEEYFNCVQCIYGEDGSSSLPYGGHTIPFTYQIPFTAPSSFNHDRGQITYSITAYLVHEDGSKEELIKEYNVIAPLNLNSVIEEIKKPIEIDFDEVYSCNWFCMPKPILIRIKIPLSGYCPGETIPITVAAQNDSNIDVNKISFMLISKERYHSQRPVSQYIPPEEVIVAKKLGPIMRKTAQVFTTEIKIPDMIAPNLENCSIIDVGFFIKVKINLSGCNRPVEDEAKLRIGLVSMNNLDVHCAHPMSDSLPNSAVPDPNDPEIHTQAQEIGFKYTQDFETSKHRGLGCTTIPSYPVPSDPYLSIADVVDKSRHDPKIDLYTSHEIGFIKTHDILHSAPLQKPGFPPPNPIPNLPRNKDDPYLNDPVPAPSTPTN